MAATIVGALAGGVVGNGLNKGEGSKWTAVAGAVVGGLGARELEKAYDRRKDKDFEEEERRARRDERRRERERN